MCVAVCDSLALATYAVCRDVYVPELFGAFAAAVCVCVCVCVYVVICACHNNLIRWLRSNLHFVHSIASDALGFTSLWDLSLSFLFLIWYTSAMEGAAECFIFCFASLAHFLRTTRADIRNRFDCFAPPRNIWLLMIIEKNKNSKLSQCMLTQSSCMSSIHTICITILYECEEKTWMPCEIIRKTLFIVIFFISNICTFGACMRACVRVWVCTWCCSFVEKF